MLTVGGQWSSSLQMKQRTGNHHNMTAMLTRHFRVFEGRSLSGILGWDISASPGTTKGRTSEISLRSEYQLFWQDYSNLESMAGRFRYLLVDVA